MSILIVFRLTFFATIEITVMTTENVEEIELTATQLLWPSYISESVLEVFFLVHLFIMGG
jgi:hypothetical protein